MKFLILYREIIAQIWTFMWIREQAKYLSKLFAMYDDIFKVSHFILHIQKCSFKMMCVDNTCYRSDADKTFSSLKIKTKQKETEQGRKK